MLLYYPSCAAIAVALLLLLLRLCAFFERLIRVGLGGSVMSNGVYVTINDRYGNIPFIPCEISACVELREESSVHGCDRVRCVYVVAQILLVILQLFVCDIRKCFRGSLSRSLWDSMRQQAQSRRRCHGVSCAIFNGLWVPICPVC